VSPYLMQLTSQGNRYMSTTRGTRGISLGVSSSRLTKPVRPDSPRTYAPDIRILGYEGPSHPPPRIRFSPSTTQQSVRFEVRFSSTILSSRISKALGPALFTLGSNAAIYQFYLRNPYHGLSISDQEQSLALGLAGRVSSYCLMNSPIHHPHTNNLMQRLVFLLYNPVRAESNYRRRSKGTQNNGKHVTMHAHLKRHG
jgi:hypothetical protein